MGLRMRTGRERQARRYWRLRTWSPLIMLVGIAAGGVLIVRSILVFGVDSGRYPFGVDIPIAAAVLLVWTGVTWILLRPPQHVLADAAGPFDADRLLVWPRGAHSRLWRIAGVPVMGLLALMGPGTIIVALQPSTPWPMFPVAGGLTVLTLGLLVVTARTALYGSVVLTPTRLIAYDFLRTRRFAKEDIVSIDAKEPGFLVGFVLEMLLRRDIDEVLELALLTGRIVRIDATNSLDVGVEAAAETIRAWRAAIEPKTVDSHIPT